MFKQKFLVAENIIRPLLQRGRGGRLRVLIEIRTELLYGWKVLRPYLQRLRRIPVQMQLAQDVRRDGLLLDLRGRTRQQGTSMNRILASQPRMICSCCSDGDKDALIFKVSDVWKEACIVIVPAGFLQRI